jgi:hypothetical protein
VMAMRRRIGKRRTEEGGGGKNSSPPTGTALFPKPSPTCPMCFPRRFAMLVPILLN